MNNEQQPVTPGDLLREDFLQPMGLSAHDLAREIGLPPNWIDEVVVGKRPITADLDVHLCSFFGLTGGYWLRAQAAYAAEIT